MLLTIQGISGNPEKFKVALKHYLLNHSFYNLDEFFSERNTYVTLHAITLYKFNLYCTYYIHRFNLKIYIYTLQLCIIYPSLSYYYFTIIRALG